MKREFWVIVTAVTMSIAGTVFGGGAGRRLSEAGALRLPAEAMNAFGIEFITLGAGTEWTVPREVVVFSRDETFVYVREQDALVRTDVKVVRSDDKSVVIRGSRLASGVRLASKGVAFLRVVDMDASGGTSHEH